MKTPPTADQQLRTQLLRIFPRFTAPTDRRAWPREAARLRREAIKQVFMHGWPASLLKRKPRIVRTGKLKPHPSYTITKLRYEIYPDYWIPALLYEPAAAARAGKARLPVALMPDGHFAGGNAHHWKQKRCINLARRGIIALSTEFVGMGQLQGDIHHGNQAHFNLVGLNGVGLFYLALAKGLDVLLDHPRADTKRVAVTGLSGGGWQSIIIAALDTRITLTVPVAGYTSMRARVTCDADTGDLEQAPVDMASIADYQHLTAMLAPRPTLQILNQYDDCCFATDRTKPLIYDAIRPTYRAFDALDSFEFHSNTKPGTHNYAADNRCALYRFLNKHFALDSPDHDIHDNSELQTETALLVDMPDNQATVLGIARQRAVTFARQHTKPLPRAKYPALRKRITDVIRLSRHTVRGAVPAAVNRAQKFTWRIGPWSIPGRARRPRGAQAAELRIVDVGYAHDNAAQWWRDRHTFSLDILGLGSMKTPSGMQMLYESAGRRMLGEQVSQILAAAQHIQSRTRLGPIHLAGHGRVGAFVTLVAAALQPKRFKSLTVTWETPTLQHLIDWHVQYDDALPMFCLDLMPAVDVPRLRDLMEGTPYHQPGRGVPVG